MSSVFARDEEGDINVADENGPVNNFDWEHLNEKDGETKIVIL